MDEKAAFEGLTKAVSMAESPSPWKTASPADLAERNDLREQLRGLCKASLYFLSKGVISYSSKVGKDYTFPLHKEMCDDAQDMTVHRRYDLWPRGHFKTSVYSIGKPVWLYLNNPNTRILIAGSTSTNAAKRIFIIKRLFERNRLFQWLFPEAIPAFEKTKWSQTDILLPREEDYQEYTIEAMGVGGRVTGRHYDIMIKDDLIDEECLDSQGVPSPEMMDAAKQWHDYSEPLLEDIVNGYDHIVGTRWAENDLVDHIKRTDPRYRITSHKAMGGCCDHHPVGGPIFPRRFPAHALAAIQAKDPIKYATQFDNNPRHPSATEFHPDWLQYHDVTLEGDFKLPVKTEDGREVIDRVGHLNKYLFVDPAFSKKRRADYTGMVLVGISPEPPLGYFRIHIMEAWMDKAVPEALIDQIFKFCREYPDILHVLVEAVAAQTVLLHFGEYKSQKEGIWIPWMEFRPDSKVSKQSRIRGLRPYAAAKQIFMYRGCPIIDEWLSFPLTTDDHLMDAMAQGPTVWSSPLSDEEYEESSGRAYARLAHRDPVTGY
jgi:hypothetical protein